MPKDQANAFRAFVNEDETVQEQIKAASTAGTLYLADDDMHPPPPSRDHTHLDESLRLPNCGGYIAGMWVLLAVVCGVVVSLGGCM